VVASGVVVSPGEGWALEAKVLKPETMRTLVQMARDIFPHDHVADRYYAIACKGYDNAGMKDMIEAGVTAMDAAAKARHGSGYADVMWENDRTALLTQMQGSDIFQKMRGDLVATLYNQPEVWPLFGYEGESASHGGYIDRGFDDIDWI
jgi:hypothetical protein